MRLQLSSTLLNQLRAHSEAAYPEEGAGFLLGRVEGDQRLLLSLLPAENTREQGARHNRYLLGPEQMRRAEDIAQRLGLELIGIFHSHPDHAAQPSEFDREWALPWFSYLITSVGKGQATDTQGWQLSEDRKQFIEIKVLVEEDHVVNKSISRVIDPETGDY